MRRAVELDPSLAEAHFNLGSACRDLGDLEAALASYRRAAELRPGSADPLLAAVARSARAFPLRARARAAAQRSALGGGDGAARRSGAKRIGIVSAHIHPHSVWNALARGWIEALDEDVAPIKALEEFLERA